MHCAEAIRLDPNDFGSLTCMARAFSAQGKSDEAVRCYAEALRLNPVYAEAHYFIGLEWLKRQMFDAAVSSLREAARLDPGSADTRFELAVALANSGATSEAIAQYREALRSNPNLPAALNNLAWILATQPEAESRDGAEAVQLAEGACERTSYKQTIFIGTLAAAYAESGQFEKAVAAAQKACDLARSLGQTNLLGRNQELLQQFRKGQPYREQNQPSPDGEVARPR